jgi:outer membrane lipoprotein SlyB
MGFFGGKIGKVLGGEIGGRIGGKTGRSIGSVLGEAGGSLAPGFKNGGRVKRTGKALVHKDEYVLPAGVKPTAAQRKAVAKRKADSKKGKK